eukprot:g13185.t1
MAVQQHADIIAVSYEARALGVKKHMPVSTIRREHPNVKLVHVETIGLQNDKVSYRSYRAAARAIFTLVRAFCTPEGHSNGHGGDGNLDMRTLLKSASGKSHNGIHNQGTFEKASIDEAYLEPTRRTLLTELRLSSYRDKSGSSSAADCSTSYTATAAQAVAPAPLMAGTERACGGKQSESGDCPSVLVQPSARRWCDGDDSCGRGPSQSQDGSDSSEGNSWSIRAGYSPDDGGQPNGRARREYPRTKKDEEEEEARLLEAGGLLATRIQQTLSDVLQYDCSIGVASNKFLAKLVTNLAKPKGVRVLLRRDVASILASTPATKIPGCGAGSVAAKQFAALGVSSILDMQRIQAAELRERLGKQLGVKVYDRCRGIDHDPVEPDPIPSRVSSQLSLVPLITPAHCLGKPGEKLTPVFPWEVERVRPILATLVDDLLDRAKEELAERSRRPTKLCIEHYLHQRGSKSQIFVLPAPTPSRPRRSTAPSADCPLGGVVAGEQPNAASTSELKEQAEANGDLLVLPPATVLIELALTPFKNYRQSRRTADGGRLHSGAAVGAGEAPHQRDALPPVVKLIVSLLAFETVGPGPPTVAPPGQRTLRDMMWLKKGASTNTAPCAEGPDGSARPPRSGNEVTGESAAVKAGATAATVPETVTSSHVALVAPADAEVRKPAQGVAGGSSGGDAGGRQSRKLSHLLMMAVTPEQAADVLRDHGFLRDDGQTRFANLGLVGNDFPREQQKETH